MTKRLLTIEEKGNEIIEMCKEHGIFLISFDMRKSVTDLPEYISNHSKIHVDLV